MREKHAGTHPKRFSGGGRGQTAPALQCPRDLITLNASRSGEPHKVNQQ